MYTLQALWTMARESLDVTVVGLSNRSYAVLNFERQRVGPWAKVLRANECSRSTTDTRSLFTREGPGRTERSRNDGRGAGGRPSPFLRHARPISLRRSCPRTQLERELTDDRRVVRRLLALTFVAVHVTGGRLGEQRLIDEQQVNTQSPAAVERTVAIVHHE